MIPVTTIDGHYPTPAKLGWVERASHKVRILRMPPGETSIDFLLPAGRGIRELLVTDWSCKDLSAVGQFHNLEYANVVRTSPAVEVDFTALASLRRYAGPSSRHLRSVLSSRSLIDLAIDKATQADVLDIRAPLESLSLLSATSVDSVPCSGSLTGLKTLEVHGSKVFDLSSVGGFADLRRIELTSVKYLQGVGGLAEGSPSREIVFENCREVDDVAAFARIRASRIRLIGPTLPVDRSFSESIPEDLRKSWLLPPMLN